MRLSTTDGSDMGTASPLRPPSPGRLRRGSKCILSVLCVGVVLGGLLAYSRTTGFQPTPIMSHRRWDKLWQLLCLGPPIMALAALAALWVRRDLLGLFERLSVRIRPTSLVALGMVFLVALAYGPLQRLPGSKDEVEYLFQGRMLASGALYAPAPPCPESFALRGLIIRDGRWLAAYDPGHSFALGIADRLGAAWLVGPLFGTLALWLVYLLGRDLYGYRLAMGALCLGVLSPFFILLAACHSYHSTSVALIAFLLLSRVRRGKGARWDYALGLALGALILTRPLALAIMVLPLALLEGNAWRTQGRPPFAHWARSVATCLPLLAVYLLYNWAIAGHPLVTGRQMVHPNVLFGFGRDVVYAETYGSLGHTPLKGCLNVVLHLATLSTGLFGWPLVSMLPAAIGFVVGRKSMWVWAFVLAVVSTAGILFFSWYSAIEHGPRHYLDAWPGLILLSALGIRSLSSNAHTRAGVAGTNALVIAIVGLFLLSFMLYLPVRLSDLTTRRLGVDPEVGKVASSVVRPPAVVFVDAPTAPSDYYCSGFVYNDPWLRSPLVYARHLGDEGDRQCLQQFPGRDGYVLTYSPVSREARIRPLPAGRSGEG